MKKIINLVSVLFAVIALPISAQTFEYGNVYYRIIEGTNNVEVCGFTSEAINIVIPDSVQCPGVEGAITYEVIGITGDSDTNITTRGIASNLKSLRLPSTIKYIGDHAFRNIGVEELIIPASDSEIEINKYTFTGITQLKKLIIEDCEYKMFYYELSKDPTVLHSSQPRLWLNLEFPELEEVYMGRVFDFITMYNNPTITKLTVGEKVWYVERGLMRNCKGLKAVNFSDSVYQIGRGAFSCCTSLEKVYIGKRVTLFKSKDPYGYVAWTDEGDGVFYGCSSLKSIECASIAPPQGSECTFMEVPVDECELVVPEQSVDRYRKYYVWGVFKNIRGKDFSGIEEVADENSDLKVAFEGGSLTSEKDGLPVTVYSPDGRCFASRTLSQGESIELPSRGIYIVVAGGKTQKVIVK